jgi:hypothetical protein
MEVTSNRSTATPPILELRVAFTASDYERLVKFHCAGLDIKPAAVWNDDGGRALMLETGSATLELFDERQGRLLTDSRRDSASAGGDSGARPGGGNDEKNDQ